MASRTGYDNETDSSGQQAETSDLVAQLRNHELLTPEQESSLTKQARMARTTTRLKSEIAPDDHGVAVTNGQCRRIERLARKTAANDDTGWGADCLEALPPKGVTADERWWNNLLSAGREAADEMTRCNQRMVIKYANEFRWSGLEIEDLVQEGNLGLAVAIEKFDERRGYRFTTYANWWIRQALGRGVADRGRTIRVPQHAYAEIRLIRETEEQLTEQVGRIPSNEEIAATSGLALKKVVLMKDIVHDAMSLDQKLGNPEEGWSGASGMTVKDTLEQQTVPGPEYRSIMTETRSEVRHALDQLRPRERRVIERRYGIRSREEQASLEDDDVPDPATRTAIGREMGLTSERIRQIENQAIADLRQLILRDGLELYLQSAGLMKK